MPLHRKGVSVIGKLSLKTAVFFSDNNIISSEDIEAYAYGLEILISTVINFMAAIFIAFLTGEFLAFTVCLAAFITLRLNAGGYHAKTHAGCVAILVVFLLTYTAALKLLPTTAKTVTAAAFLVISAVTIIAFAPVGHPNHPLSEKAKKKLRSKTLILLGMWIVFCIVFYFLMAEMSFFAAYGVFTSAMAMIAAKIQLRSEKNQYITERKE